MPRTTDALMRRWHARRAKLPWHELEAEAERQGCSPADIFFDRAGLAEPAAAAPEAEPQAETSERAPRPVPWRGLDPLPASRTR